MDRMRIYIFSAVALVFALGSSLPAQVGDPSAREDEAIERQKILKAADQIDLLVQQNQKMQEELAKLQLQISSMQDDKSALQKRLDEFERNSARDKQALLKEVANIVASKSSVGSSDGTAAHKAEKPEKPEKPANNAKVEGFEYEVKSGDSLWAIAKAYQDAGVKVSVDEIRKANNMDKSQDIRSGQKLFIPKN